MKTMSPPGYHRNGFMTTHALVHMMYMMYGYDHWYFNKDISLREFNIEMVAGVWYVFDMQIMSYSVI